LLPDKLLILTALQFEAAAIARRIPAGDMAGLKVIGPAGATLTGVTGVERSGGIIMAGLAGALDPTLSVGDIVVDQESTLPVPGKSWRRGKFHTASEVIGTAAQKRALFAATGALVVEMENAVVRAFASGQGLPFLGIRAVSDHADEPLDPAVLRWVNPGGGLRPGRLAAELCLRPWKIAALWRLGRHSRLAVNKLAQAVSEIVRAPVRGGA
jgi:hypothetical protein